MLRLIATICGFMIIGTVGGMECHTIGMLDGLIRIAVLMVLTVVFHRLAEAQVHKAQKKKKTLKNGNSSRSKG